MATLISQESNSFFTLTTEKGKTVEVQLWSSGGVTVYIQRNGMRGLPLGRTFSSLSAAMQAYKASDIKSALMALSAAA